MQTHTEEKLFTCEICWSAFLKSDTLIRHLQTRTREKPYFCEVCKCGCSDESILKDHIWERNHFRMKCAKLRFLGLL